MKASGPWVCVIDDEGKGIFRLLVMTPDGVDESTELHTTLDRMRMMPGVGLIFRVNSFDDPRNGELVHNPYNVPIGLRFELLDKEETS